MTAPAELEKNTGPIEVWLSQQSMEVRCAVYFEDETSLDLDVDSLSMRGAQREMTAWLIARGYEAAARWVSEDEADSETHRQFRRKKT